MIYLLNPFYLLNKIIKFKIKKYLFKDLINNFFIQKYKNLIF